MSKAITARQAEVLRYIAESITTRGFAPTVREIMAEFRMTSTNGARDHLAALIRKRYLARDGGKSRALRVLRQPIMAVMPAQVPPRDAVTAEPVRLQRKRGQVALYWQIKTNEAAVCAA